MKQIISRFDSKCPQCKVTIKVGDSIGLAPKVDKVWRCVLCTQFFEELGPRGGLYLSIADRDACQARDKAIVAKYPHLQGHLCAR